MKLKDRIPLRIWGQKGHYGVAILSKIKPENVQKGFAGDSEDDQKRFIQAKHSNGIEEKS